VHQAFLCFEPKIPPEQKRAGNALISMGRTTNGQQWLRFVHCGGARRTTWSRFLLRRRRLHIVFAPIAFWIQPVRYAARSHVRIRAARPGSAGVPPANS
jgi:hypothetical protein